jgi:hypothetical protein
MNKSHKQSASLDWDVVKSGNPTDTWPAISGHFVVVFDAGQVSDHV